MFLVHTLFIAICLNASLGTAVSVSVTFVLLDRIFILLQPIQYKKYRKLFILVTLVMCVFVCLLVIFLLIWFELPFDETIRESIIKVMYLIWCLVCVQFGCALRQHGSSFVFVKCVVGFVNVVIALFFQWTLCAYASSTQFKHNYIRVCSLAIILFEKY
jgi:hypothetical protein